MSRVNEANPPAYNFTIKFLSAMKPIQAILWVVMLFCMVGLHAQTNQWTWVAGDNITVNVSNYGTIGVAAATNHPGPRSESTICTDKFGNLWLFGGKGKDVNGTEGLLNDLWKWDGTNWTWMAGSNLANQPGNFGTQGIANVSNIPPARNAGICGFDNNGVFWLFGGNSKSSPAGDPSGRFNPLNDLWKWDGTNWTWVKGDSAKGLPSYGTLSLPAGSNTPGARSYAVGWNDNNGNLWLFGGYGARTSGAGRLNDVWKWDGNNWTWVRGDTVYNSPGNYGAKLVASNTNTPASRSKAINWVDKNGKLFLLGGFGVYNTAVYARNLNDTWYWDGNNWVWTSGALSKNSGSYGTKGIASSSNQPEARANGVSWRDDKGNFWLFGGIKEHLLPPAYSLTPSLFNDMWKWDGTNWTWVNGSDKINQLSNFGAKGVASSTNIPGARAGSASWYDNKGILWLMGGFGTDTSYHNSKNLLSQNYLNDLWKWDGTNWTWVKGRTSINTTVYASAIYGKKGIADSSNTPAGAVFAISWSDKLGNGWLYGGSNGSSNYSNILWKWDGTNWTYINGDTTNTNNAGVYGTKGVADPLNSPGVRSNATIWKDSSDNVYLFGGTKAASYNVANINTGYLTFNDLWKWDGTNWTWLSGSNTARPGTGKYGTKGIAAATNLPPERAGAAGWTDNAGNLWLYGGNKSDSLFNYLNDLWVWDGKYWTWMGGDSSLNVTGVYGAKGINDANNKAGARAMTYYWTDKTNNGLWLFGGEGMINNSLGNFNDLWKYSPGIVTAIPNYPATNTPNTRILLLNNPSATNAFQFLSDQFYQKLNWQILDISGRTIQEGNLHTVVKGSEYRVVTKPISDGIYFIRFLGDNKRMQTVKWVKQ